MNRSVVVMEVNRSFGKVCKGGQWVFGKGL